MKERGKYPNRIAEILVERGMTQSKLCDLTELSSALVSNYVTQQVSPSLENAVKIADALNVTLDELVGRTGYSELDADEYEALHKYRALDDVSKSIVMGALNAAFESSVSAVKKNNLSQLA